VSGDTAPGPFSLSVVVPAYEEAENLRLLIPRLLALEALASDLHVVVVDDHSADDTFAVVRRFAAADARVTGVRLARNSGSHLAILCGLRVARGDAAVVLAADGQDPPEEIERLVQAWRAGAHVVWAVRAERKGETRATRLLSRLYYSLMNRVSDVRLPPAGADFFLLDRVVVDALVAIPERSVSLFALIASLGFRQVEVAYVKGPRISGRSKWSLTRKVRLLVDSLVGFSTLPLRLATILGFLYTAGGVIYAALVLFGVIPATSLAALMAALLISSGTIMVILGIFGEYLWRALDEVRGRPRFLVEDSVNTAAPRTAAVFPRGASGGRAG
jgi:dolichol-phosphate mannosyltransferase